MKEIQYFSEYDASMQPALICPAEGAEKRPLAVCLHTWSYGLEPLYDPYLAQCRSNNWHMIYPYFRGPNWTKEACGSDYVVSDLKCAVQFMKERYPVDESAIYLVGGSGGGHAALLMAGRCPELWTAVSAWCPISDIAAWFAQKRQTKDASGRRGYDDHIFDACGGDPLADPGAMREAAHRSPLTWLHNAKGTVILDIATGIHDGHTGSVPVSHAINAFNAVAEPEDRVSPGDIDHIVTKEEIPSTLRFHGEDPIYGDHKVLFRRTSLTARLTLFEGTHEILYNPAFAFLKKQRSGAEPVWDIENPPTCALRDSESPGLSG